MAARHRSGSKWSSRRIFCCSCSKRCGGCSVTREGEGREGGEREGREREERERERERENVLCPISFINNRQKMDKLGHFCYPR